MTDLFEKIEYFYFILDDTKMSYVANSILRLFNADNTQKATAIVTKNGEIMQLKPIRQVFKTLGEWHTDEDHYMKVEVAGLNNDFLLFQKYNPESNLTYTPSEMKVYEKKKKKLSEMSEYPHYYIPFKVCYRDSFYMCIAHKGFKTIKDADEFLQEYIKKGLGVKVNSHIYNRFRDTVNELGLTSTSSINILLSSMENKAKLDMPQTYDYKILKKDIEGMESRNLSSTGSYKPRILNRVHLYCWQNRNMKPIYINYQKKVFTLGSDTTTYKTLKSAGIDKTDVFYMDPLTKCIVPI